ncbi:MAG: VTT domain-containing protein [Proteobacteria bacterium]|nr:VTT domain-containing protein [Pseudomonadota bacterium]
MTSPLWRRFLPALVLLAGLALFLVFGPDRSLSFEMLARHHAELVGWVAGHRAAAIVVFVAVYALAVAFSLPVAILVTPLGGFLFGLWLGALLSVIGATAGSVAVFVAARSALGDVLQRRAAPWLHRFEDGFRRDGISYLLFLRLVPVFPFWLVNIVPALLGMRLLPYTLATLVGIVPAALVYAGAGAGFGAVFARGETPDLGLLLQWPVLLPLLGLSALSLLPVLVGRLRGRRGAP